MYLLHVPVCSLWRSPLTKPVSFTHLLTIFASSSCLMRFTLNGSTHFAQLISSQYCRNSREWLNYVIKVNHVAGWCGPGAFSPLQINTRGCLCIRILQGNSLAEPSFSSRNFAGKCDLCFLIRAKIMVCFNGECAFKKRTHPWDKCITSHKSYPGPPCMSR